MEPDPAQVLLEWKRLVSEGRLQAADKMVWGYDSGTISAVADLCFGVASVNPKLRDMYQWLGQEMRRKASLKIKEENGKTVRISTAEYAAYLRMTDTSGTRFDKP